MALSCAFVDWAAQRRSPPAAEGWFTFGARDWIRFWRAREERSFRTTNPHGFGLRRALAPQPTTALHPALTATSPNVAIVQCPISLRQGLFNSHQGEGVGGVKLMRHGLSRSSAVRVKCYRCGRGSAHLMTLACPPWCNTSVEMKEHQRQPRYLQSLVGGQ
ncbi:hypothetical protein GWK47_045963 [Chionoecetes opilio]|uniref:Uncharacterized protein n=1 Tax=Chionoecetes opilio TaxID=41210 RepID=A0A8J5CHA0_CHIOP|nr:hypothetical protein GWK47_045963 [Chionoecetes opilio]